MTIAYRIDASFSKVEYCKIAPKVGLDPIKEGDNILTFEIHRARLPYNICHDIMMDLMVLTNQYGTSEFHQNKEVISHWISGIYSFNFIFTRYSATNICIVF